VPGNWLTEASLNEGCSVTLIAFIERFGLYCNFQTYTRQMMHHTKARGECDPWRLFGWILKDPRLTAHLRPYGGSRANDPFHQLVSLIGVPSDAPWLVTERVNEQPGRLAIATALAVLHLSLCQGCPLTGRRERKRASRLLQATSNRHCWHRDCFNRLTSALYREVRDHYRTGNDLFAQQVWGATN